LVKYLQLEQVEKTMQSTVFTSGGHRLDTSLSKKPAGVYESLAGLNKESCNIATNVLSTIHNSESKSITYTAKQRLVIRAC